LPASSILPAGQSEYEFAGAIKGAPIEVFPGTLTGPADPRACRDRFRGPPSAQITLPEGPFGEFTGYYASDARPASVMEVAATYHRDDPILLGSPPMKPPRFHFGLPFSRRDHLAESRCCGRDRCRRRLAAVRS